MRFLVPEGQRVLDLGCGGGDLLASLKPAYGVGVDISEKSIAIATGNFPGLEFATGDMEAESLIKGLNGPYFPFPSWLAAA